MQEIKRYFLNGVLQHTRTIITYEPEIEIKELGEIITSPHFNDMIYENNLSEIFKLIIEEIKTKNKHLLFYGSAGTGKSATAKMLATETNRPFIYITGSQGKSKIKELLLSAKDNSIVLIDEIHNLSERIAEVIYPAIQDEEIYSDGNVKKLNVMFIGTTTEPEKLPKPLLERFNLIEFEELSGDKVKEVLIKKGCDEKVSSYLLNFTTNFRIINNLIDMIKLYGEINEENLVKVFRLKKINLYSGLSDYQEKYLDLLKTQKRMGLRALGIHLRKSEDYIKFEIEPDLIRKGMIMITSRGRELTSDFNYQLKSVKEPPKYSKSEREQAIKWLNDNPEIKNQFGSMYLELVNFIAEKIKQGIQPDLIDFASFGIDNSIENSYKNNYLCEL